MAKTKIKPNTSREARFHRTEPEDVPKSKTEAFVETGTEIILELVQKIFFCWHGFKNLYSKIIALKSYAQGQIGEPSYFIGKSGFIN